MRRIAILLLLAMSASAGERERAAHVLDRLAFGARPGEVDRVTQLGVDRWIELQLHPERGDDAKSDARVAQYAREVIPDLSAQRILRAAESERQLNEVMLDFWMNHFNVFAGKRLDRYLIADYERETIRPRMWGSFEELLLATAKSPAMLVYLDNARSRGGALNENYARELMELHTLGVDGGYTQKDVTELARVLTGWSITRPDDGDIRFVFRRGVHDGGTKQVLGVTIQGGGMEEGERMIRFLARHPSTARFLATKLCQRLVADEPPPALVARVALRFTATNGDLRETVRAIVTSREFHDPRYYDAKMKSPFEYAISAIRAAGGTIVNPLPLARELRKLGEPLYFAQPPTGYADDAETWGNSGALVARVEFALALSTNKLRGIRIVTSDADALAKQLGAPEFQRQ
ncbi:MAG TPA: DUF1800 domain-containing protein [Thermoanaerobaculia bacterium]|nr:DUF1800 domain-containing protein [Thermoanaerobaculia bacterium]